MDIEDKELIERFRNEETRNYAFNLLVRKYQQKLYHHIRRIVIGHEDADDVLQNAFIKVWKHLDGFNEEAQLYTWLYRIATNESISFLNQKRRKFLLPIVNVEAELSKALEDSTCFNGDEINLKLQKAILKLPEKQRIVFNMKYYEDLTYEDMSQILNTSVGALKASYHLAVKKIEASLLND